MTYNENERIQWHRLESNPRYLITKTGLIFDTVNNLTIPGIGTSKGILVELFGKRGIPRKHYEHRLVAEQFITKSRPNKNYILHKNDDVYDNRVENLCWVNLSEYKSGIIDDRKIVAFSDWYKTRVKYIFDSVEDAAIYLQKKHKLKKLPYRGLRRSLYGCDGCRAIDGFGGMHLKCLWRFANTLTSKNGRLAINTINELAILLEGVDDE